MKGRILFPLLAVFVTCISCLGETEQSTSPQAAITSDNSLLYYFTAQI